MARGETRSKVGGGLAMYVRSTWLEGVMARFDTGGIWLSMPESVFNKHGNLGQVPGILGYLFTLDNDVYWWVPVEKFMSVNAMANATGFGGLAKDMSLDNSMCIFGNEIMKGLIVACNLEKAQLGFGGMCINVGKDAKALC